MSSISRQLGLLMVGLGILLAMACSDEPEAPVAAPETGQSAGVAAPRDEAGLPAQVLPPERVLAPLPPLPQLPPLPTPIPLPAFEPFQTSGVAAVLPRAPTATPQQRTSTDGAVEVDLDCGENVARVGEPVNCSLAFHGDLEKFAWSAPGGSPDSGTDGHFETRFRQPGKFSIALETCFRGRACFLTEHFLEVVEPRVVAAPTPRTVAAVAPVPTLIPLPVPVPGRWERLEPFTIDTLRVVHVASPDTVYIGGEGAIYRTVDGGVSWEVVSDLGGWVADIQFVSADEGFAVDHFRGDLRKTVDGGESWTLVADKPLFEEDALGIYFIDSSTGWMVGFNGVVARTDDGGRSWARQSAATRRNLTGVYFADEKRGWVGAHGSALATSDGGNTWREITNHSVSDIEARLPSIWMVGGGGFIYYSGDVGATWEERSVGSIRDYEAVEFVDDETGWIVGNVEDESAIVIETRDGGLSWRDAVVLEDKSLLQDVGVLDTPDGPVVWAVGNGGLMLRFVPE